jgi:hypothetical protein
VHVSVLEGLHQAEDLVDVSANGEVVHGVLAENTLGIDDVSCAERDSFIFSGVDTAAVVTGDVLGDVRNHGEVHGAKTARLSSLQGVLSVSEFRVNRAADELDSNSLELCGLVGELADLGGTHEGEIQRPEEEDDVLA